MSDLAPAPLIANRLADVHRRNLDARDAAIDADFWAGVDRIEAHFALLPYPLQQRLKTDKDVTP